MKELEVEIEGIHDMEIKSIYRGADQKRHHVTGVVDEFHMAIKGLPGDPRSNNRFEGSRA
jgi:hypothetical protein